MQSEKYSVDVTAAVSDKAAVKPSGENKSQSGKALKLIVGVAGIYAAFLYYGTLQEDVFHFVGAGITFIHNRWI